MCLCIVAVKAPRFYEVQSTLNTVGTWGSNQKCATYGSATS